MFGLSPFAGAPLSTLPGLWHRYDHAAGDILALHELKKRGVLDVPTVVEIRFTDQSSDWPWRERGAIAKLPGVDAGTVPHRPSTISLPGIPTYAQAYREAVERLNTLNLGDLDADTTVFDRGASVEVGDVLDLTHPIGLTAKALRCLGISGENGRYRFAMSEYDPAMYSDAVETGPSQTDTTLPSPLSPEPVTGLSLTEGLYQLKNGIWSSRLIALWTASVSPFVEGYRIELILAGVIIDSASVLRNSTMRYATPPVEEGSQYTVRVYALTSVAASVVTEANATPAGKYLVPGDVASITGFEAGGMVYLAWIAAADLDVWRYELRYGLTTDAWAAATLLDRVDALRYQSKQIPVGNWRIFVKAIDSVGLYSNTAATCDVTVTLDAAAFLVDSVDFDTPTLTNMSAFTLGRVDPTQYAVSEDGVAFGTKFSAAMNTYTNPLASYSSSIASSWESESHDFGSQLSGDWRATMSASALSGSITRNMRLSPDNAAWTDYPTLTAKAVKRYARVKAEASGTSVILVAAPTEQVRIDAIPREENFSSTSSAAGPVTVTCANVYAAVKDITISPTGTVARSWTYDNVVLGTPTTFDVYIFNDAGTKVANAFTATLKGY